MERRQIINLQAQIYNLLPSWLQRPANNLRILPRYLHWYLSLDGRKHAMNILAPLQNKFHGYRCVVIGNGPSLRKMELDILKNEFTFGMNRIYLLFDELGFETNFFVAINGMVLKQYANDIRKVQGLKFLNWFHRDAYKVNAKTVFLCSKPGNKMKGQITKGFLGGTGTVTNVALELAYFMGFSEVILIGVDHSYSDEGPPGQAIVSNQADRNHFSPDYFGPGAVWQLPNFKTMEFGYRFAKALFERSNRFIVDATLNGKLDIFPRVHFRDYLIESNYKNKLDYDDPQTDN